MAPNFIDRVKVCLLQRVVETDVLQEQFFYIRQERFPCDVFLQKNIFIQ